MLNFRLPPSTSIRSVALRATAAAALLGIGVLGSACSGSPAAPGTLSAGRRVETGSGGGTFLPCDGCEPINGRIEIVSVRGTLNGSTSGWQQIDSEPRQFDLTSTLKGEGKLESGSISLSVERETATINVIEFKMGSQIFQDKDVTAPATVTVTAVDKETCTSGSLVETTISTTLENFGKATITERHCAP